MLTSLLPPFLFWFILFFSALYWLISNNFFPRLAGSYEALEAGNTGDALVDFTGGVCESINLKDGGYSNKEDSEKRQTLFKSMERAMREKSLISASIRVCSLCAYIYCTSYCNLYTCIWVIGHPHTCSWILTKFFF